MAIPFIYTLSATARAAYPFIVAGTRKGLSGRAIERSIRKAGLPISRPRSIVPLMREIQRIEVQGIRVRYINRGSVVNVERLPEAITKLGARFSYTVELHGVDQFGKRLPEVGDEKVWHSQVITNDPSLTRSDIEQLAIDDMNMDERKYPITEVTADLRFGVRRLTLP